MGILSPQKTLIIALPLLFLSKPLFTEDFFEEPWNPSLELSSEEDFDDGHHLSEDYLFHLIDQDPLDLYKIAEEPKITSHLKLLQTPGTSTLPELQPTSTIPEASPTVRTNPRASTERVSTTSTTTTTTTTAEPPTPPAPTTSPTPIVVRPVPGDTVDNTRGILINFSNVSIVEFIRFISRASNKNFIFDEANLQFNVSIVSEEPTSLDNIMAALMQVLRVHGLSLIEQGNNILIHNNKAISQVSTVVSESLPQSFAQARDSEIITRVFRLNTLDPEKAAIIIAPLISEGALVEVLQDTSHIIVTDLSSNVSNIGQLLRSLDAPNSGLVMGQYVVVNALLDSLIDLAEKVMNPISEGKPLVFVAHPPSNSIFVVSTPFLVDRALAVLNTLDINVGATRIFGSESLKFSPADVRTPSTVSPTAAPRPTEFPRIPFVENNGGIGGGFEGAGGPRGPGPSGVLESASPWSSGLPAGHIERTKFFIHKLRYRRGEQIVDALGRVGFSLMETGSSNIDLISTIQSIQWLEGSNSLVFSGTAVTIAKVRELIDEIDTPLRQVFVEMLILETTLDDSLNYGVNFGSRFATDTAAGAQAFLSRANTLSTALDGVVPGISPLNPVSLARDLGYNLGIIGRTVSHCGTEFSSIGALINALHDKEKTEIIMNPRILVEDNATAEIFVGINTPFKTQSIANDQGSIITNNVEFRDVGTRMKITPLISNNDIITLDILEEVSSVADTTSLTGALSTADLGPSTRTSKTTTKVHVPNKFFLVMSGMIQQEDRRRRSQVPCLGGVPILGGLFSEKRLGFRKRNLMIFIRPQIIDTDEDIDNVTRHQQDVYRNSGRTKKMWKYEVEEALDLLNIKEPDVSLHDTEQFNP